MRVLFREVGSTMKRSYATRQTLKSGVLSDDYANGSSMARSMTQDSAKRSRIASYPPSISPMKPIMTPLPEALTEVKGDDDSDRSFLPIQGQNGPPPTYEGSVIVCTTEVEIEFQDREEVESPQSFDMVAVAL